MNDNLTLRPMRADELPDWLDFLCEEIFPHDPREAVESLWHNDPYRNPADVLIAVNDDGLILASVKSTCRLMNLCGQPVMTAIISGVGVRSPHRGQGLIRRLLEQCDRASIARGAVAAHLYSNADTLDFYLHMGYQAVLQRPGEDFHRMFQLLKPFDLCTRRVETTEQLIRSINERI